MKLYKRGFLLWMVLCLFLISGCAGENAEPVLPFEEPVELVFSSGAGAWGTVLELAPDGAFTGSFHDTNMGEAGEGYPNGTVYLCSFEGKFSGIEKMDDNRYRMTLEESAITSSEKGERIEDGIRYVVSDAYGLEGGREFIFYMPETPVDTLDETFLSWWPLNYPEETRPETLSCYGLHNVETGDGFFDYASLYE